MTDAPSAWLEHGPFAFWLTETVQPQTLVELGTHSGFSYLTFCQAVLRLGLPTSCYAIDTWRGDDHSGFYGEEVFAKLSATHERSYAGFSTLVRALFDDALPRFADGSIDLLHIDGRHDYKSVSHDYETWLPKLSERGIVLFHDTNERAGDFGVWRLWNELSNAHPSFEFLHGHGLGILAPSRVVPEGLVPLLWSGPQRKAAIRAAYVRLGKGVLAQHELYAARARIAAHDHEQQAASRAIAAAHASIAAAQAETAEAFAAQSTAVHRHPRRPPSLQRPSPSARGFKRWLPARSRLAMQQFWRRQRVLPKTLRLPG